MKSEIFKKLILFVVISFFLLSCSVDTAQSGNVSGENKSTVKLQPISEEEPITISEKTVQDDISNTNDGLLITKPLKWSSYAHASVASIALSQWGISQGRINIITDAANYPDVYQAGFDNGYKQQWYHAYIYDDTFGYTYYLWGGADTDFDANINGPLNGNGYNGYYAGYYYGYSDQLNGDKYLGYAIHYIEDVCIVLHSTAPDSLGVTVPYYTVDMAFHHGDYEAWVDNNMSSGWRLIDAVANDYYYYAVTDLKQAIKNAAWNSCAYKGTSSIGYSAWKAYRDCGYPTAAGTGPNPRSTRVARPSLRYREEPLRGSGRR